MYTQTQKPANKPLLKVINMMPMSIWLQYKWLNSRTTTSVSAAMWIILSLSLSHTKEWSTPLQDGCVSSTLSSLLKKGA